MSEVWGLYDERSAGGRLEGYLARLYVRDLSFKVGGK